MPANHVHVLPAQDACALQTNSAESAYNGILYLKADNAQVARRVQRRRG